LALAPNDKRTLRAGFPSETKAEINRKKARAKTHKKCAPVSIFLFASWRLVNAWSRAQAWLSRVAPCSLSLKSPLYEAESFLSGVGRGPIMDHDQGVTNTTQ
jgi:hypothetical protein